MDADVFVLRGDDPGIIYYDPDGRLDRKFVHSLVGYVGRPPPSVQ